MVEAGNSSISLLMKEFLYSLPKSERNPSFAIGYPILAGMVDAILNYKIGVIDVPCSGTGVISKRIEIKWRRNMENISEMVKIQSSIINNVSK